MNKLILVTAPDDVSYDAVRILLVGLAEEQTDIVSSSLQRLEDIPNVVVYVWNQGDSTEWLFDKKQKSCLTIFNAEFDDGELVGYFSAQSNAHYFGNLKTLGVVNNRALYDIDQCHQLIKEKILSHEKTSVQ